RMSSIGACSRSARVSATRALPTAPMARRTRRPQKPARKMKRQTRNRTSAPIAVMEARQVPSLPSGEGWQYEPKWDGFRCLAVRDGKKVELIGRSGKSLVRYFPEVVAGLAQHAARDFILDGELA